jgi:hypothetical protein
LAVQGFGLLTEKLFTAKDAKKSDGDTRMLGLQAGDSRFQIQPQRTQRDTEATHAFLSVPPVLSLVKYD